MRKAAASSPAMVASSRRVPGISAGSSEAFCAAGSARVCGLIGVGLPRMAGRADAVGSPASWIRGVRRVPVTEEQLKDALSTVNDPEIGMNIVELGLVYDIGVDDEDHVSVEMTLTSPGCPLGEVITQQVEHALKGIGARSCAIEIVWSPPWTPDMMSEEAKEKLGWGIR